MGSPKRRSIEAWLTSLEERIPRPVPAPVPPEVAAAFHDPGLAVQDPTGSPHPAPHAGLRRLAKAVPNGGDGKAGGREALDRLLVEAGWGPAEGRADGPGPPCPT